MLEILYGPDRLENTQEVLRQICAQAARGKERLLLIVPEQYSHETERALCEAGGDAISRHAEVLSFSRLCSRVFSLYGGVSDEYLDKGGKLMTLYLAVWQVRAQLKYFAGSMLRPAFLTRLGEILDEMMNECIQPQELQRAAGRTEGQFSQKLTELALVYESYLSICRTGRGDPVDRMLRLLELLQEEDCLSSAELWLDGFSDFTRLQAQVVQVMLEKCPSVHLALMTDRTEADVFLTATRTLHQLTRAAAQADTPCRLRRVEGASSRSPRLTAWLNALFLHAQEPEAGDVRLYRADGAEAGCRQAASLIRRFAADGGRLRDVSVAMADPARDEARLRALLSRAGLSCYCAGNDDVLTQPLLAGVLCALEAAQRLDYASVLAWLKSGVSGVDAEQADCLERYAYIWNLRGAQWEREWTLHPDGVGAPFTPEAEERLRKLNELRSRALQPLLSLRAGLRASGSVTQTLQALADFFADIRLSERLDALSVRCLQEGELQQAQQLHQLYEILISAMEQMHSVLGPLSMETEVFVQLFSMLLGQYQVGTIPAAADQVQLTTVPLLRHRKTRYLILLGVEEGKLPAFSPHLSLLSDAERQRLGALGVGILPGREQTLARELGWVYDAFSSVLGRAAMICASDQPSYLFTRTQRLLPGALQPSCEAFYPDARSAAGAALRMRPLSALPDALRPSGAALQQKRSYRFSDLDEAGVRALYGSCLYLSPTKIDAFSGCRFAYFLRYGLKAAPWRQARVDAPLYGTFVHDVLEHTVQDVLASGGFQKVDDETLRALARQNIRLFSDTRLPALDFDGGRQQYLFARNEQEVLDIVQDVANELRVSDFQPLCTELRFAPGAGQALAPLRFTAPHGSAVLTGVVDRVDLLKTQGGAFFRVVDYKTGRKDFDYSELLRGRGLQMLLYLFALARNGRAFFGCEAKPAGVLYVSGASALERLEPGSPPEVAEASREKKRRRKGLLLADDALLAHMEHIEKQTVYLPCKRKEETYEGSLASPEQLRLLDAYVTKSVEALTEAICTGSVTPNPIIRGPLDSSCQSCDYRAVCHEGLCEHQNRYTRQLSQKEFWQEAERSMADGKKRTDDSAKGGR